MIAATIKTRLTLLFTALVAIILAISAIGSYSYSSFQRSEEFNNELLTDAIATAAIVLRTDNLSPQTLRPFRQQTLQTLPFERLAIFNKQGKCVFHSGEQILQLSEYEQQQAMNRGRYQVTAKDTGIVFLSEYEHAQAIKNGKFAISTSDTQKIIIPFLDENGNFPNSGLIDSQSNSIPVTGNVEYIVVISAYDKRGLKSLQNLRNWLIGGYLSSLLFVFFAGIYFAARAMEPISVIRQKAEKITATDFHIRLDEGNKSDELALLAHAFNGMLDRLEAAFKSQKQFVAHASHELRTPITDIIGQLDVTLMQSRNADEYKATMTSVLESMRHLNRLLNNLLLLAQTESESLKHLRVDDILFSALREIKQRYPTRKLEVQLNVSPDQEDTLGILGNEGLLRVALVNVLENAVKFSEPGSLILVSIEVPRKESVIIKIQDRGTGIAPENLALVFQPFFRSNPSSKIPGNGIGLALVKSVMERHGGTVSVESELGKGTNVVLEFRCFIDPVKG